MSDIPWRLPGFAIEKLLGFGATGEVWAAREIASGERVALKRLRPGGGAGGRERLVREAALLSQVTSPHVVRLRRVVADGDSTVLVLDHAAGGSLAALLAVRGRLATAEVVTVVAPLARALAELHERGLRHGDVTPANVLFTADGRPLLGDLGVACLVGEPGGEPEGVAGFVDPAVLHGATPGPSSDVYALAAVGVAALTGEPPAGGLPASDGPVAEAAFQPLAAVFERVLLSEPSSRPSAGELATAVLGACAPAPVGLVRAARPVEAPATHRVRAAPPAGAQSGAQQPAGPGRRWRSLRGIGPPQRAWRRALVALVAAAALCGAVAAGQVWAARSQPSAHRLAASATDMAGAARSVAGPIPDPVAPDPAVMPGTAPASGVAAAADDGAVTDHWRDLLAALDRRRAEALARGDGSALRRVYSADAPTLTRDEATLRRLLSAGERPRGLRFDLVSVSVASRTVDTVMLRVVDRLAPYDVVTTDGRLVRHDPGRGARSFTVELVHDRAAGWVIRDERVR